MMLSKLIIVTVFVSIFTIMACNNVKGPDSSKDNGNSTPAVKETFSSIQANVFNKSCAFSSCHGGTQNPNLSAGKAYKNLVNKASIERPSMLRVKPGDSANSYLIKKLRGDGTSTMPPSGKLSAATIDSIASWIDRGAKND